MKALLERPDFKRDSKLYRIESSLPTMSVPNWATILTVGANWSSIIFNDLSRVLHLKLLASSGTHGQ